MSAIVTEGTWVADDEQLRELCSRWMQQSAIGLDTEFIRTSTFFPIAALFQVSDGRGCYLIDPLALENIEPLRQLLVSPGVTKIMHASSEDLEVFRTFCGDLPEPLFDTQLAAAFAGMDFSMGYARLVEALLNVSLPKSETRSDWLQRPLSESQCRYAALDVAYLPVIYGMLMARLREQSRLEWLQEDCQKLVAGARQLDAPEAFYRKIKLAWKLSGVKLLALKNLAAWREQVARDRDVPRNRVLKENVLWEICSRLPAGLKQLKNITGLQPRTLNVDGAAILEQLQLARSAESSQWPQPLPKPLDPEEGQRLKLVRAETQKIASELGVAAELLGRKKDYESLIRDPYRALESEDNGLAEGWRSRIVAAPLLALLQSTSQG